LKRRTQRIRDDSSGECFPVSGDRYNYNVRSQAAQIGPAKAAFHIRQAGAGAEHHCISPNRAILVKELNCAIRRNARFLLPHKPGGIHAIGAALRAFSADAALCFGACGSFLRFASDRRSPCSGVQAG